MNISEMIYIVNKELHNSNDDMKKKRYTNMINILKNIVGYENHNSNFIFGTKNYKFVFEKLIDDFFYGEKNKARYYPRGSWVIESKKSKELAPLRMDTIVFDEEKVYIIDAKYYRYSISNEAKDLPGTDSIQKQITYADYIYTNFNNNKIRNIFIVPFNSFENDFNYVCDVTKAISYIGYATADWRNNNIMDYDNIYTFMVDLNYLLNNYKKNNCETKEKIFNFIEHKLQYKG